MNILFEFYNTGGRKEAERVYPNDTSVSEIAQDLAIQQSMDRWFTWTRVYDLDESRSERVCPYCKGPRQQIWECIDCGQVA